MHDDDAAPAEESTGEPATDTDRPRPGADGERATETGPTGPEEAAEHLLVATPTADAPDDGEAASAAPTPIPASLAAVAGVLSAGLALGTGELLSGISGRIPSLVTRVGDIVIDNVPGSIERWAIDTFGTNDKPALIIGITIISLLIGAGTGIAASRRFQAAWTVFGAFGLIGALAAGSDPQRGAGWGWFAAVVSALVGVASLAFLLRSANSSRCSNRGTPRRSGART